MKGRTISLWMITLFVMTCLLLTILITVSQAIEIVHKAMAACLRRPTASGALPDLPKRPEVNAIVSS